MQDNQRLPQDQQGAGEDDRLTSQVFAAKDEAHNNAQVLKQVIEKV